MKLPNAKKCCGCSACFATCPKHAIVMQPDAEGFLNPVIDESQCIHCGQCEKVCPVLHQNNPRAPILVTAAKAKDDNLRIGSASGGIFTLLANETLRHGGIIFGAGFERPSWRVIHKAATNVEELDDLRGSKYVQSDMGNCYQEARQALESGHEVLFSGCPCQIAGLNRFLGRKYNNLLTVDLICHGVPSPLAWEKYLETQVRQAKATIRHIDFRRFGKWRKYSIALSFSDTKKYFSEMENDPFLNAFLKDLCIRKTCHACAFRHLRSGADITIGDFWGIEKCMPEMEDDKGVSVVIANSRRGKQCINGLNLLATLKTCTFQDACCSNNRLPLLGNCRKSPFRASFFKRIRAHEFCSLVNDLANRKTTVAQVLHFVWWAKRIIVNHEINKL